MSRGFRIKKTSKVNYTKGLIIGLATVITIVVGYNIYNRLPIVKVNKAIAAGNMYSEISDYEAAISS